MPKPDEIVVLKAEFRLSWPNWRRGVLEDLPEVCVVGRSNVGKSSLLNTLVARSGLARTSATPGRTQALNVFDVALRKDGIVRPLYIVDLPGYGYADAPAEVRAQWRPMVQSYFDGSKNLRLALVLLDARREKPNEGDLETLDMLADHNVPTLLVVTKIDKLPKTQRVKPLRSIAQTLEVARESMLVFSSVTREGRDDLLEVVYDAAAPEAEADAPITLDRVP